jgi:EAL and modified HD-GYP domain-containing signal transduction protein
MPAAFIARQPIFNHKLEVVGYELLFRGAGYAGDALIDNSERATATVVLNSLTELELNRIVGTKTAWINVSREFVLGGLAQAIPPDLVGLEIPESELFDEELITALRELKQGGYRLALDDFRYRPGAESLLEIFDIVKLNMPELGHEQLREHAERLQSYDGVLLANKVETRPDHEFCIRVGCDLFQGRFFCQPAMIGTRGITANRLALLQVVAALQDPDVELADVEQLVARDVALSYRMLRYVNSAFFGVRSEVRSIGQALALLGVENVRRWTTLSVLAGIDNKPTELTMTALIRARFCELAAGKLGIASPAELFTLGLFSVIDGMMDAPMQDVVASLPLADDMREALVSRHGEKGRLLDCVTSLETGEYGPACTIVPGAGELYLESLIWANTAAESLFGQSGGAPAKATAGPATAGVAPATADGDRALHAPERSSNQPPTIVFGGGSATHQGLLGRAWASCLAFLRRRFGGRRDDDAAWDAASRKSG